MHRKLLMAIAAVAIAHSAGASIIFDNFETGVGHFTSTPTGSGTTNMVTTASTTALDTTTAAVGNQSLKITGVGNNTTISSPSFPRIRELSGGGTPANNVSFTTTSGTDGFIGLYYKTSDIPAGGKISIYLDGADGASGSMNGATPKAMTADGQWHLVEWNLDSASDWGVATGIGGVATLANSAHTIDSIFFSWPTSVTPYNSTMHIDLDFIALNPGGSIANLVPEPSMLGIIGAGALATSLRRRREA